MRGLELFDSESDRSAPVNRIGGERRKVREKKGDPPHQKRGDAGQRKLDAKKNSTDAELTIKRRASHFGGDDKQGTA